MANYEELVANVKDFSAVGDGVTDDSTAIAAAVASGAQRIVFPYGTYCFSDVNINRNIVIDGGGWATLKPIHLETGTNQNKTMFNFDCEMAIMRNFKIIGDASQDNSASAANTTSLFDFDTVDNIIIENCFFSTLDGSNRLGAPSDWENRKGLIATFYNCGDLLIRNCEFTNIGGDEWLWRINENRTGDQYTKIPFEYGRSIIENNYVRNVDGSSLTGQYNVTGTCFNFFGGHMYFRNNRFEDYTYPGSIVNCGGPFVTIEDNSVIGCCVGSVFDTCEGDYVKNEQVIFENNFVENSENHADDSKGVVLKTSARILHVKNNTLLCRCGVYWRFIKDHTNDTFPKRYVSSDTMHSYDEAIISGNIFFDYKTGGSVNYPYTLLGLLNAYTSSGNDTECAKVIKINDNIFKHATPVGAIPLAPITFARSAETIEVVNNKLNVGDVDGSSYHAAILMVANTACNAMLVSGNTIENQMGLDVSYNAKVINTKTLGNDFPIYFTGNISHIKNTADENACDLAYGNNAIPDINYGFDGVWTDMTLANDWVVYSSSYHTLQYKKIGNMVYLRGIVKDGTATTIASLPSGFTPSKSELFLCGKGSDTAGQRITINTAGVITATGYSTGYVSFSGVMFSTDD